MTRKEVTFRLYSLTQIKGGECVCSFTDFTPPPPPSISVTGHDPGLWAVVNNAGVSTFGEVEFTSMETYKQVSEVNLWGTIRVTKAVLPLIRRAKGQQRSHCALRINSVKYKLSKTRK